MRECDLTLVPPDRVYAPHTLGRSGTRRRRIRTTVREVNDAEITALVTRLARPHASGGVVIERAAMLAEGADFPAVMEWIIAHAGKPETTLSAAPRRGLHGSRLNDSGETESRTPLRFVLPAGALV
jgi:hypothetical protein